MFRNIFEESLRVGSLDTKQAFTGLGIMGNITQSLIPGKWNSFCIKIAQNMHTYKVNNVEVSRRVMKPPINLTVVELMNIRTFRNGMATFPLHGEISDVSIWNRSLTELEEKEYHYCGLEDIGNVFEWKRDFNTLLNIDEGIKIQNETGPVFCAEETPNLVGTNLQLTASSTFNFCKAFGRIAKIRNKNEAINVARKVENIPCDDIVAPFKDEAEEGLWIDQETGEEMQWKNWNPGQPDNWLNKDHCSVMHKKTLKFSDVLCKSRNYCQVCEVAEVFQLRGVCTKSKVDIVFKSGYIQIHFIYYIHNQMFI